MADPDNPVGVQVEHTQAGELPEALNSCQLVEGEVQVVEASGENARGDVGCEKWTGGGQRGMSLKELPNIEGKERAKRAVEIEQLQENRRKARCSTNNPLKFAKGEGGDKSNPVQSKRREK